MGYFSKSTGVTMFTRTSVHCAERIVATTSSQALLWVSAQVTSGYIRSKPSRIARTRSGARGSYAAAFLLAPAVLIGRVGGFLFSGRGPADPRIGDALDCGRLCFRAPSWRPLRLGWRGVFPRGIGSPSGGFMVANRPHNAIARGYRPIGNCAAIDSVRSE